MIIKIGKIICVIFLSAVLVGGVYCAETETSLYWPPEPAQRKIVFVKSVYSTDDLGIKAGFFKKLTKVILGGEKAGLGKPVAVAVNADGAIFVCDTGECAVHLFFPKEKRYKKITAIHKEELLSPVSVAVADNGLIFIADSQLKKVFCLDQNGAFKFSIGGDKSLLRPTGLQVNKDKLFVVDTISHTISLFDLEGNFLRRFGKRGKGNGEFNYPTAITVDASGRIYVSDTLNFRIQVFDEHNKFLSAIGQLGNTAGSFVRPKGVAVDSHGHIYVTDGVFDNIQIFDGNGQFMFPLGKAGQKSGEFWIPSGIAVDKNNYIYVADSYNQRIQIFRYLGD